MQGQHDLEILQSIKSKKNNCSHRRFIYFFPFIFIGRLIYLVSFLFFPFQPLFYVHKKVVQN